MIQRIIAAVLLVGGLASIALGVASATVWRAADTVVASATPRGDGTFVVTAPGVLDLVSDNVTIRATVPGKQQVTIAVGRDIDVMGWAGEDPYTEVTGLQSWTALATKSVTAPPPAADAPADAKAPAATATPSDAAAAVVGPDPIPSDMWVARATGEGTVDLRWSDRAGRWSLIAAGVGEDAKAPTVRLTWPHEVSTPWLWPGVVFGAILCLLGALLLVVESRAHHEGGWTPVPARKPGRATAESKPGAPSSEDPVRSPEPQRARADGAPGGQREATTPLVGRRARREAQVSEPTPQAPAQTAPTTQTTPTAPAASTPAASSVPQASPSGGKATKAAKTRWGKAKPTEKQPVESDVSGVSSAQPPEAEDRPLTRREMREREENQRGGKKREEGQRGGKKSGGVRALLTGQIPLVRPRTAAQPTVKPAEGSRASTARGDAWRQAWGFDAPPTPPAEKSTDGDASGESGESR